MLERICTYSQEECRPGVGHSTKSTCQLVHERRIQDAGTLVEAPEPAAHHVMHTASQAGIPGSASPLIMLCTHGNACSDSSWPLARDGMQRHRRLACPQPPCSYVRCELHLGVGYLSRWQRRASRCRLLRVPRTPRLQHLPPPAQRPFPLCFCHLLPPRAAHLRCRKAARLRAAAAAAAPTHMCRSQSHGAPGAPQAR